MNNTLLISLLMVTIAACNSPKKIITIEKPPEASIEDILGTKYDCVKNSSASYKLCFTNEIVSNVKYVSFAVYETNTNVLIYKESLVRKVKWESENVIRVDNFTRMPTGEGTDDYYLFNVLSNEKTSIKQ